MTSESEVIGTLSQLLVGRPSTNGLGFASRTVGNGTRRFVSSRTPEINRAPKTGAGGSSGALEGGLTHILRRTKLVRVDSTARP